MGGIRACGVGACLKWGARGSAQLPPLTTAHQIPLQPTNHATMLVRCTAPLRSRAGRSRLGSVVSRRRWRRRPCLRRRCRCGGRGGRGGGGVAGGCAGLRACRGGGRHTGSHVRRTADVGGRDHWGACLGACLGAWGAGDTEGKRGRASHTHTGGGRGRGAGPYTEWTCYKRATHDAQLLVLPTNTARRVLAADRRHGLAGGAVHGRPCLLLQPRLRGGGV